jgi:hypothetical protein
VRVSNPDLPIESGTAQFRECFQAFASDSVKRVVFAPIVCEMANLFASLRDFASYAMLPPALPAARHPVSLFQS